MFAEQGMFAEHGWFDGQGEFAAVESFALRALAFVLTYGIHSTLLLGSACLLISRFAGSSLRMRERLWKVALFGGLVTASAQVGLGWRTPLAHWTLEPRPQVAAVPADEPSAPAETREELLAQRERYLLLVRELRNVSQAGQRSVEDDLDGAPVLPAVAVPPAEPALESAAQLDANLADALDSAREPALAATAAPTALPSLDWRTWLAGGLAAWCAFAALVVAVFAAMWLRLARRLRGRTELVDGTLRAMLDRLALRAGGRRVRLFVAPELRTPVSFGWLRRTICVPPRALTELTREEQESMLAHEYAHLERRDPLWLSFAWLVERVFFFQPLNRVARAELHDLAELLCDDWAATRTGNRVALASCLARIASWIVGRSRALPATSMAGVHGRSRLRQRIERLLDDRVARRDEAPRRAFVPLAIGLLSSAVLVVPGVAAATFERSTDVPDELTDKSVGPRSADEDQDGALGCEMLETPELSEEARATAPTAAEPQPEPATSEPPAAEAPAPSLESDLTALDEAVSALENEIARLRAELEDLDLDDDLADVIDELDERAERLARRRTRLHQLIDSPPLRVSGSPSVIRNGAPFAFQVR